MSQASSIARFVLRGASNDGDITSATGETSEQLRSGVSQVPVEDAEAVIVELEAS
jgi:hypothetical protein